MVEIYYSESADFFQIIDKASLWDYSQPHPLKKIFDLKTKGNSQVIEALSSYQQIRRRYYKKPLIAQESKLFRSNAVVVDPIEKSFYYSRSLTQAFSLLRSQLSKEDYQELMRVFHVLRPFILKLFPSKDSMEELSQEIEKQFVKTQAFNTIKQAGSFLVKKGLAKYPNGVLFVFGVEGEPVEVEFFDKLVLVRIAPTLMKAYLSSDAVVTVIVKSMINALSVQEKRSFEEKFLTICPLKSGVNPEDFFLNPLSHALGEMVQRRADLDYSIHAGLSPWAEVYSKLLFPLVVLFQKKKETFFDGFNQKSALLCQQLKSAL